VVSKNGYDWEVRKGTVNPISGIPNPTGHGHYSDTHLVLVNNRLECWYRYNPPNADDTANDNETNIIYRQVSDDVISWSEKEVVISDEGGVTEAFLSPSVEYLNGKYCMWYLSYNGETFYRESDNAKNWTSP